MEIKQTCKMCGAEFMSEHWNVKYCDSCRKYVWKRQVEEKQRIERIKRRNRSALEKQKDFDDLIKEIIEYNEKCGTNLSYGQYIAMRGR